jgi:hypothetical protein
MKKIFGSTALLAIAAVALFTACNKEDSSSVDQSKIWLAQTVDYDANTGITIASAQFRFSNGVGTLLRLDSPANLQIEGEDAEYFDALALYKKQYTGVKDSATFVYTDHDNNSFTNTILVGRSIDLPAGIDTISKSAAYDVLFQGQPLVAGETATVYIKEGNGTDWQSFTELSVGATKITMTTNKLQNLNTGGGQMKIERVKFGEPADNPGKGGLTTSKYSSQVKQIVIVN